LNKNSFTQRSYQVETNGINGFDVIIFLTLRKKMNFKLIFDFGKRAKIKLWLTV